jgi:mono/diheme cytochrome c family protein
MSSDRYLSPPAWALAPFLAVAALGCADFSRGGPAMDTGEAADAGATGDGGALSFAADIYPLLTICQNCHVPGGAASSTSLIFSGNAATDYPTVLQFVATATPASSRILSKVSGNGHGGGTIYAAGTTQYETILAWIQQGAPP